MAEERVLHVSTSSLITLKATYLVLPHRARLELPRDPLQSVGVQRVHSRAQTVLPSAPRPHTLLPSLPRPTSVSFAILIASSSVLNRSTAATGPKISSCAIFISFVTSPNTVGWT